MSYVTVLVVRDGRSYVESVHWRVLSKLLSSEYSWDVLEAFSFKRVLDGGYCVIDYDRREVVSRQGCIGVNDVQKPLDFWI